MSKLHSVLIIDDDTFNLLILERVFKKNHLCDRVLTATNGEEAIEKIEELLRHKGELPQLILLDINMPIMNGIEFLKKITDIVDPIPFKIFVMLTTSLPSIFVESLSRNLITGYIDKPLTEAVLRNIMEKYFIL